MSKFITPDELRRFSAERRSTPTVGAPRSYNKKDRTADFTISVGSPVKRWFGTEKLRVRSDSVDLSRMQSSGTPVLDSHQQQGLDNHLGSFRRIWFEGNRLIGRVGFNDTPRGRMSEGMVARSEIKGISAGYIVHQWEIRDKDGNIIDPEVRRIRYEDDLTFEATCWELLEGSLVSVPADSAAMVRSLDTTSLAPFQRAALERMRCRQRMLLRMRMIGRT